MELKELSKNIISNIGNVINIYESENKEFWNDYISIIGLKDGKYFALNLRDSKTKGKECTIPSCVECLEHIVDTIREFDSTIKIICE